MHYTYISNKITWIYSIKDLKATNDISENTHKNFVMRHYTVPLQSIYSPHSCTHTAHLINYFFEYCMITGFFDHSKEYSGVIYDTLQNVLSWQVTKFSQSFTNGCSLFLYCGNCLTYLPEYKWRIYK